MSKKNQNSTVADAEPGAANQKAEEQSAGEGSAGKQKTKKRKRRRKISVKRNYKDSVFRMIFKERSALLSLYNALNGTDYQDEEALEVNTLKNAIYLGRKNDVSFLIYGQVNVYEHQSTVNDNMPLRDLVYIGDIYSKLLRKRDIYSAKRITVPRPHFVVFYNGTRQQEAVKYLRLSDAFEQPLRGNEYEEPELELAVRVININQGFNEELKESCRLLNEYTIFIGRVREYANKQSIEEAVHQAIDDCIRDDILREFLMKNRAEVSRMNIYEYDMDRHMDTIARESREDGFAEGKIEGTRETIFGLVRDGDLSIEKAALRLGLSVEEIAEQVKAAVK